jgi:hypothetical protein
MTALKIRVNILSNGFAFSGREVIDGTKRWHLPLLELDVDVIRSMLREFVKF